MKKQIKTHSQKLLCLSFNRAGDKIAVGSEKDGVAIWRWETKMEPVLLDDEESGRVNAVAFDPTGKYLATGGGFLFSSPDECHAALERLQTEPGLRAEMGERGRRAAPQLWSREAHLERYLRIVDEVLGARTG